MSVCIIGGGRCGTHIVLAVLRGHPYFKHDKKPQNREFFTSLRKYPENYITKCEHIYIPQNNLISKTLELNPDLKIIFIIRNPKDMILSKIRRGQSKENGGDCGITPADDANPDSCIKDLYDMFNCYKYIKEHHSDRVFLIKLEDILKDIRSQVVKMCNFLNIEVPKDARKMIRFIKRVRNPHLRERYNQLDKKQIDLWKNWGTVYDGFLVKKNGKLFHRYLIGLRG